MKLARPDWLIIDFPSNASNTFPMTLRHERKWFYFRELIIMNYALKHKSRKEWKDLAILISFNVTLML